MIISSGSGLSYKDRRSHQKQRFRFVGVILAVLAGYLLVSSLLVESWVLESGAMVPTYGSGTRFLVHPYLMKNPDGSPSRSPRRGDLVSFVPPYVDESPWPLRVLNPLLRLVSFQRAEIKPGRREVWENERGFKRVIGVPGDTVKMNGSVAYIKEPGNEFFLSEFETSGRSYDVETAPPPELWGSDMPLSGSMDELRLSEGEYFVLGDNRTASNDSRYWGPLPGRRIRGRVIFFYWPFRSFGPPG